ncbi:hypothetical protein ABFV67_03085 [Vibrio metschnikovii]|uniref:hypothetical protein n=1 Tax=Vibrio metschnikovii TaxID=28172 RepID=UPI0015E0614B|nr:hypothetical protein [Vibrio fluvialis]EKO3883610.1 hypothetical protein [Vibrio metschnikovii]
MNITYVPKAGLQRNSFLPQTFLAQGSGLISFVINWPIFGNAKSGDDTGGYSSNNA